MKRYSMGLPLVIWAALAPGSPAHATGRNPRPTGRTERRRVFLTHYYAGPRSETFTGRPGRSEGVAVDPRYLPLGCRVRILTPAFRTGWLRADDTGRRVKGAHIDLRIHRRGRRENVSARGVLIEVERGAAR